MMLVFHTAPYIRFAPLRLLDCRPIDKLEWEIMKMNAAAEVRHAVNAWMYSEVGK